MDQRFPTLCAHLTRHGVNVSSMALNWFLTMFVTSLPLEGTLRVWDVLFFDRCASVLFRCALALVDIYAQVQAAAGVLALQLPVAQLEPAKCCSAYCRQAAQHCASLLLAFLVRRPGRMARPVDARLRPVDAQWMQDCGTSSGRLPRRNRCSPAQEAYTDIQAITECIWC